MSQAGAEIRDLLRGTPSPRRDPRRFQRTGTSRGARLPYESHHRWSYFQLTCGHWTTPETQEFYSVWKPKRGMYFCGHCFDEDNPNHWVTRKRTRKVVLPDEPPF